jgi:uncharacterized protein (TIGR02246 family)
MGMASGKRLKLRRTTAKKTVATQAERKRTAAPRRAQPTHPVGRTVVDRHAALRALAQRIIDATLANDEDAVLALYADDVESREAGQPPVVGRDAIRAKLEAWRGMVSDAVFQPLNVVVDGHTIVIEWVGRITLAASGRIVELTEVAVHEIANGRIVRERYYYDPALLAP